MSEFRQDLVSGDWIIMASERAKRPHDLVGKQQKRVRAPKRSCPFEDLEATGNWPPVAAHPSKKNWKVVIIPNKYPALHHRDVCAERSSLGPYERIEGIGNHELLLTRDHDASFADIPLAQAVTMFSMLQEHYRRMRSDSCLVYASTFANWGPTAGASIYHPHYQIITLPIIPPRVKASLFGSQRYFRKHHRCPHCEIIAFERTQKSRIVARDARAVAFSSYVSPAPFSVTVFPTHHAASFEDASRADITSVARVLQQVLRSYQRQLKDPDYNFFIHTAPLKDRKTFSHYHWHIEIVPKIALAAGFELSTGIDINVIDPDVAAAFLRGRRTPRA